MYVLVTKIRFGLEIPMAVTCAGYFETLSSDLVSDVELPRTTLDEQQQRTCTWQGSGTGQVPF